MAKKTSDPRRWRAYQPTEFDRQTLPHPPVDTRAPRSKAERTELRALARRRRAQATEQPAKQQIDNRTWREILADDRAKEEAKERKRAQKTGFLGLASATC